jgi:hypothetical protein
MSIIKSASRRLALHRVISGPRMFTIEYMVDFEICEINVPDRDLARKIWDLLNKDNSVSSMLSSRP